jgi:beta-lactam-binding protein with PASTA domain/predicted Ser/Thr protein kinase
MTDPGTGTMIDGRYKVLSRLGAGGMADVYLAEDQQLGRKVALKLLHRRFAEDPGFVERFRREAQAAAGLQHPNVVSVYDRGTYDDTYYIAMEYLPGRSLKQLIRQEAPLDPIRAIDIALQILKAARFAHRRGVIHRDLKPHNVIVDDSDHAKVTDFGIARAGASDMTETGSIMGTAQYLSPEQAQGHAVSAGSDLYSIGVVLYEMLTARVPFDAESAVTIALKHVSEAPPPPTVFNPQVPHELEQVVLWTLNKNPSDRPTDADQMITALEHARAAILAGSRGELTMSMAAMAAVGGAEAYADSPAGVPGLADGSGSYGVLPENGAVDQDGFPPPEPERKPHRRWPWIALALALLIAGAAVAAYLITRPAKVLVPSVANEQINTARTQLQNQGFTVTVIDVISSTPAGIVIGQDPPGGQSVAAGSTIALTVSSGPGNTTVPGVLGDTLNQAKRAILQAGLKVGNVSTQTSRTVQAGQVISTDPAAGQNPQVGTAVNITVSSGVPTATVPSVVGQSESAARDAITSAGFAVGNVSSEITTSEAAGDVIGQTPNGDTTAEVGAAVDLVIAKAPPTATVPGVIDLPVGDAISQLTAAGFRVVQQTAPVLHKKRNGIVIAENPGGGSTQNKGATVTITVGQFTPPTTTSTSTSTTSSETASQHSSSTSSSTSSTSTSTKSTKSNT